MLYHRCCTVTMIPNAGHLITRAYCNRPNCAPGLLLPYCAEITDTVVWQGGLGERYRGFSAIFTQFPYFHLFLRQIPSKIAGAHLFKQDCLFSTTWQDHRARREWEEIIIRNYMYAVTTSQNMASQSSIIKLDTCVNNWATLGLNSGTYFLPYEAIPFWKYHDNSKLKI